MSTNMEHKEHSEVSREKCEEITKETMSLLDALSSTSSALVNTLVMMISITIAVFAFSVSLLNALKPEYAQLGSIILSILSAIIALWILLEVLKSGSTSTLFVTRGTYDELLSLYKRLLDQCKESYCKETPASTLCHKINVLVTGISSMKRPILKHLLKRLFKLKKHSDSPSYMT